MRNKYKIDKKIEGDELQYVNKMLKYFSTSYSTRIKLISFLELFELEMFKDEHYVIFYYLYYFSRISNLAKIDFGVIKKMVSIDKAILVDSPHVNINQGLVKKEEEPDLLVQMVDNTIKEIESLEGISEETYEECMPILKELVGNLEVYNLLFTSSKILFEGVRFGNEILKGREGYIKFLQEGLLDLKSRTEGKGKTSKVTKEYLYSKSSSGEEAFRHPLSTIQKAWGNIKRGESISILAPNNIGKSTMAVNYIAESLIAKLNTAVFLSEMMVDRVYARIISVVAARKYKVAIPSDLIIEYFRIDKKKLEGKNLTEIEVKFLKDNGAYINNIEFIHNAIVNESNKELGTLLFRDELVLRDLDQTMEMLAKEYNVATLVVDHVNGIEAGYALSNTERLNLAYIKLNSLGKKYGIITVITNHVPEEFLDTLNDPEADKTGVRGYGGNQSTFSPDKVILITANQKQKSRGEFIVMTNKDRDSNSFFEPFLSQIHIPIGLIYEPLNEDNEGEQK